MLTRDEITLLADVHYTAGEGYDDLEHKLFGLLVDVAETYANHIAALAPDNPAPGLGGTTPVEVTVAGLYENLILRQEAGHA
jgi:hypothetical protein